MDDDDRQNRDAPEAIEHTPTTERPYATLNPADVLRARRIIAGRFRRADDTPAELGIWDTP